jgi:hypothetical protein
MIIAKLLSALAGLCVLGLASAVHAQDDAPSAATGRICESVVGVRPGESHYGACIQSLTRSASVLDQVRALSSARAGCLARGLDPNTPEGARCVLTGRRAAAVPADPTLVSAPKASSYLSASRAEARRRFETACASLGYDPTTRGFDACVTRLQSSMFLADNPLD